MSPFGMFSLKKWSIIIQLVNILRLVYPNFSVDHMHRYEWHYSLKSSKWCSFKLCWMSFNLHCRTYRQQWTLFHLHLEMYILIQISIFVHEQLMQRFNMYLHIELQFYPKHQGSFPINIVFYINNLYCLRTVQWAP